LNNLPLRKLLHGLIENFPVSNWKIDEAVLDFITGSLQRVYPFLSWQLARQKQNTYTVVKVEDMLEGKLPFRLFLLKSLEQNKHLAKNDDTQIIFTNTLNEQKWL
jgi:hypothetical protein